MDYYHVTEDQLPIADAQTAANSLNALGASSPFAPGFTFANGTTLTTSAPGQVTLDNWGNLIMPWSPSGSLRTEGLDFSANYIIPLDDKYGKVTLGVVANVILDYSVSTGTGRPFFDYSGTFTPTQGLIPSYNLTPSLTYEYGGWTFYASAHYIPESSDPGGLFPESTCLSTVLPSTTLRSRIASTTTTLSTSNSATSSVRAKSRAANGMMALV